MPLSLNLEPIKDALANPVNVLITLHRPDAEALLSRIEELEKREQAWVKFGDGVKNVHTNMERVSSAENKLALSSALTLRPPTV